MSKRRRGKHKHDENTFSCIPRVINGIIIEHNRMAAKVMAECGVPVNDFYGLLVDRLDLARGGKDKFHWNGPAYQILGDQCVEAVLKALPPAQ